jgi:hypothetical protein
MFNIIRAGFAVRSHTEVWNHIKSTMIDAGVTFPLQSKDYIKFATMLNASMKALPHAPWTKADYSEPHMLNALWVNIEAEVGLNLVKVCECASIQMNTLSDSEILHNLQQGYATQDSI